MSADEGVGTPARTEAYRAAARAAVGEIEEIESLVMALEARLVKLRTRVRTLTALLGAIRDVVPDAAMPAPPYSPLPPRDDEVTELPRRRRTSDAAPGLDDLPVRLAARAARPTGAPPPSADEILGLSGEGRHASPPPARLDPLAADLEAWG
ncbi:MAG: hypothetical protein GX609_02020 [Actinomycetales bacterium]|nr:hypothetical protein [Actinomycetales bacterium]